MANQAELISAARLVRERLAALTEWRDAVREMWATQPCHLDHRLASERVRAADVEILRTNNLRIEIGPPRPEPGEERKCLVCARERPWAIWSETTDIGVLLAFPPDCEECARRMKAAVIPADEERSP